MQLMALRCTWTDYDNQKLWKRNWARISRRRANRPQIDGKKWIATVSLLTRVPLATLLPPFTTQVATMPYRRGWNLAWSGPKLNVILVLVHWTLSLSSFQIVRHLHVYIRDPTPFRIIKQLHRIYDALPETSVSLMQWVMSQNDIKRLCEQDSVTRSIIWNTL